MATGEFPDCENVMCDLAELIVGQGKAYNELPEDIGPLLPIAWCVKIGGNTDGVTDRPILQVSIFAEKRSEALRLSNLVRETVLDIRGKKINGVLVDTAEEINGIKLQRGPAPQQPMIAATYKLSFRRQ
jgi:hypothetical protein